uniref:NUC domain-containing protein n=1 Tax=Panagrellus redivivus TaxID=6233 RepID=A0A7E4ZZ53_PANRE
MTTRFNIVENGGSDDDFGDENEPMLSPSSRSEPHGTLSIDDGPIPSRRPKSAGSNSAVVRWAKSNFRILYGLLIFAILLALIVLVVALFLVFKVKRTTNGVNDAVNAASEQYRVLYEQIATFKTGRHGTFKDVENVAASLTPEQLAMAKQYGLIPDKPGSLAPGMDPIKPISTSSSHDSPSTTAESPFRSEPRPSWMNRACDQQCENTDYGEPPLLIISLDGFAREYLDRNLVPSLDALTRCGSRAEFVYPSYPSKTFPNHYTIATGLYPEVHGIVDNAAYDPKISPVLEDLKKTKYPQFFGGEPIWSQAVRSGKKMFCLFWPGCSFNITGHNPTKDFPYNRSLAYSQRVDMVIDWLKLPKIERPDLIMAYFDQPDYVGHFHKTDDEVNVELQYIETVLSYFFARLHTSKLTDCVNIVILSDHGMQFLHKKVFVDRTVDINGMIVANGVIGRIHMANSTIPVDTVMEKFTCPNDKTYRVFQRQSVPKRYHYARTPRVGDLIFDGRPGTTFYPTQKADYGVTSDHGYDYLEPAMHAIMFAHGPNIAAGVVVPPFQNVEYFNFFVELLRLPHEVPNNGTLGVLRPLIKGLPILYPPVGPLRRRIEPCLPTRLFEPRHVYACSDGGEDCKAAAGAINENLDRCTVHLPPVKVFQTELPEVCLMDLCSVAIVGAPVRQNMGLAVLEVLTKQTAEKIAEARKTGNTKVDCGLGDQRFDLSCPVANGTSTSIMANELDKIGLLYRVRAVLRPDFVNGPFAYLQNLTQAYAKAYDRILVTTGPVYDSDLDGNADPPTPGAHPTHIYRIILRCEGNRWDVDGYHCRDESDTRVIAFVISVLPDTNCLEPLEYLLLNTARIRDIELLTGLSFFIDPEYYSEIASLRLRTAITQNLWKF